MESLNKTADDIKKIIQFLNEVDSASYFEQMSYLNMLIDLIGKRKYDVFFEKADSAELWGGAGSLLESEYGMSADQRKVFDNLLLNLLISLRNAGKIGKRAKSALKMLGNE